MFNLTPPYLDDNPLFQVVIRRVRWAQSTRHIWRYSLEILIVVLLVMGVLWLGGIWIGSPPKGFRVLDRGFDILNIMIFTSVLLDGIIDFACVAAALNVSDHHTRPVWWDLIRLSAMPRNRIIVARHALAQVRVWWLAVAVASMRVAYSILTLILYLVLSPLVIGGGNWFFIGDALELTLIFSTIAVFMFMLVVEPIWRMKAVTALGVWISARVGNPFMKSVSGFLIIIVLWAVQAVGIGIFFWCVGQVPFGIDNIHMVYALQFVFFSGFVVVVYCFYIQLRIRAIRHAVRHLYHD
jgi:hypothetical protein